ncbi:DUF4242 domain-containing protein [Mucilaginibacter sp. UR6-11]|uniref:DUF4242 domain-containing protein n=1 Tax=Mucilaginibacter sp. UR6-11 TaxID=1435644 RepID=UPI001E436B32|nr:DUF4242 domain-containing protein [Mucilaginibacter sp. UR6-11]MCC8424773.1 DUF4242 domain-containing protein [Mucilaginibacter sp. UR6-11]
MKKFVIERHFPGLGNLSAQELQTISQASCTVLNEMGKPYHWVESFITGDKMYCIHIAENEDAIREHASLGGFPVTSIAEVTTIIDPATSAS